MPKIVINEQDLTSPGVLAESTDVVYIPGFVDISKESNPDLYTKNKTTGKDEYVGIEKNKPTLITSIAQFNSLCGNRPAFFKEDQKYSDLVSLQADGSLTGFDSYAVPYHGVMFRKGTADPAYVMAKELLAAGLNVLFERINNDDYTETFKSADAPSDWTENYAKYEKGIPAVVKITDSAPPLMFKKQNGYEYKSDAKYYTITTHTYKADDDNSITTTAFEPVDNVEIEVKDEKQYVQAAYKNDGVVIVPEYYVQDTSGVKYFTLAEKVESDTYQKGKYCKESTSDSSTFVIENSETEPADWAKAVYYKLSDEIKPVEYEKGPEGNTKKCFYIPYSWILSYTQGVASTLVYERVTADFKEGAPVAPAWDATTTYRIVSDGLNIKTMYKAFESIYAVSDTSLADKGNYSIKYLTSGGYPTYEYSQNSIVSKMLTLSETRGDCVAFIDHTNNPSRNQNIDQIGSLYNTVKNDMTFQGNGEFGTMFTPWAIYNRATVDLSFINNNLQVDSDTYDSTVDMPGSFAYFLSLADSITVNPNWLAIAGVARGTVQNLAQNGISNNIPNGVADKMTPRDAIAVNPITNIKPYGYTIWGNRTLIRNTTNLVASSFLNIRNLVSDIKKEVYRTCRKLTFEQNSDVLWVNIKAELAPLLDRMLHGYGISSYRLQLDPNHPKAKEKATLCFKILLSPIEPVEDFYVSIILQDDENITITE